MGINYKSLAMLIGTTVVIGNVPIYTQAMESSQYISGEVQLVGNVTTPQAIQLAVEENRDYLVKWEKPTVKNPFGGAVNLISFA